MNSHFTLIKIRQKVSTRFPTAYQVWPIFCESWVLENWYFDVITSFAFILSCLLYSPFRYPSSTHKRISQVNQSTIYIWESNQHRFHGATIFTVSDATIIFHLHFFSWSPSINDNWVLKIFSSILIKRNFWNRTLIVALDSHNIIAHCHGAR